MACGRPLFLAHLVASYLTSGCLAGSGGLADTRQPSDSFDELLRRRVLVTRPGPLDVANRHHSTVQVLSPETAEGLEDPAQQCSGSLIGPRLVLTAAHCVCGKRKTKLADVAQAPANAGVAPSADVATRGLALRGKKIESVTTASDCARRAIVKTVVYEPRKSKDRPTSHSTEYEGAVRAHPGLELLFDEQNMVWASADLAVIFLSEPVEGLTPYKLAEAEVHVGDRITMVGYGLAETKVAFGERRLGENKVSWIRRLESGGVEFVAGEQKLEGGKIASHVYGGDSGGGCFKVGDSTVLMGINGARAINAKGEVFSVFTSVYSYKAWLTEQIDSEVPDAEKLRRSTEALTRMRAVVKDVLIKLEEARRTRDVVKLNCLNEKLTMLKSLLRISEQSNAALQEAITRREASSAEHEYTKVIIAREKVDDLRVKTEECIG